MNVNLESVTDEALALTQMFVKSIRTQVGDEGQNINGMDLQTQQIVSGLLAKLMRAATGMVKEARALAKDAAAAAAMMTQEDKRRLIIEFIELMPAQQKAELRAELGWL